MTEPVEEPADTPAPGLTLTPDLARAALEFMGRATLHAAEIETFLHVRAVLEGIARRGSQ